ncbi:histidine kinase [Streptomyces sp. Je 1-79]|uniref:sensor histidine kinase n=1 Tax=Streptomyces sp. Je 1-79 TaxID=2943847 RepID=UPI0021A4B252|nr:histidine kinase [Streptomyces sp. Je 1-79]MCT4354310.1 histidine kinase [Streptomyces sp. Je 1-79]
MRRERLRDLLLDLGLWGLLATPVLLRLDPHDGGSWGQVAVGVVALGAAVACCRSLPLLSLAVAVALSLATSPELFTPAYALALVAFGYLAGRRQRRTRAALALFAAVAALGFALVPLSEGNVSQGFTVVLVLALAIVAPWLTGRYVRQYARLVRAGWELAARMEHEQAAVADRERLRERSRIAGDMHDSLGHDLALIALRAAALEVDPGLGARQQAAAGELRVAAADATARLRDIIGVLRPDEEEGRGGGAPTAPAGETVEEVVERAGASGLRVELTVTGPEGGTPPMVDRAVHRLVVEALTNAAKHAPGAPVRVALERAGSTLTVAVSNGPGTGRSAGGPDRTAPARTGDAGDAGGAGDRPAGPVSGGTGLVGLDERVRLAGGRLTHGARADGGFAVRAVLPLEPGAAARAAVASTGATGAAAAARRAGPIAAPTSVRERERARREVRRGLAQAIWIPLALVAALGLVMLLFGLWTQSRSFLDRDDYVSLRVGDPLSADAERLPPHPLDGPPAAVPPEPPGMDSCLYYRAAMTATVPVYRLCLVDGRLAEKAVVG